MWTMIISPIGEKKITISTHSTKKNSYAKKKKKTKKVYNFRKRNEQAKRTQTKREKKNAMCKQMNRAYHSATDEYD